MAAAPSQGLQRSISGWTAADKPVCIGITHIDEFISLHLAALALQHGFRVIGLLDWRVAPAGQRGLTSKLGPAERGSEIKQALAQTGLPLTGTLTVAPVDMGSQVRVALCRFALRMPEHQWHTSVHLRIGSGFGLARCD